MNLGKAIRLCRIQKDMSLEDLSDKANISISYLSLLERGKRDPNFSKLQSIAFGLDIPVSILVFLAGKDELNRISPELADKLAGITLNLIQSSAHEKASI
jgi:transcriptional regulator with XRE-family HTH domain